MRTVAQTQKAIRPYWSNSKDCLPEDEIDRRVNAAGCHILGEDLVNGEQVIDKVNVKYIEK